MRRLKLKSVTYECPFQTLLSLSTCAATTRTIVAECLGTDTPTIDSVIQQFAPAGQVLKVRVRDPDMRAVPGRGFYTRPLLSST